MTQTQVTPVLVSLEDLLTLPESTLYNDPLIAKATRPYDEAYAKQLQKRLALVPVGQWTPLEGMETEEGVVILDGQHRYNAAIMGEYPIDASNLEKVAKPDKLPIKIHQFSSNAEIAATAYKANMEHGKAYDTGTRTAYALELFHHLEHATGKVPSERDVARQAGISNVTLNEALKKEKRKAEKIEEGTPETPTASEASKLVKKFTDTLQKVHDEIILEHSQDGDAIDELATFLASDKVDFNVLEKTLSLLGKARTKAIHQRNKASKAETPKETPKEATKKSAGKKEKLTQTTLDTQIADATPEATNV